ncbi:MAG: hypothetical protein R2762_24190 [Bryobacteraceae bacterium]
MKCTIATLIISTLASSVAAVGAVRRDAPETGDRPGHPFTLSNVDSIDNVTGNVALRIPIASLPSGHGGMSLGVDLLYNSAQVSRSVTNTLYPLTQDLIHKLEPPFGGNTWRYGGFTFGYEQETRSTAPLDCQSPEADKKFRLWINLPDGSRRLARLYPRPGKEMTDNNGDGFYSYTVWGQDLGCSPDNYTAGPMVYYTTDSSNIRIEFRANGCSPGGYPPSSFDWMIYLPDGTRAGGCGGGASEIGSATAVYDRNGNRVTISGTLAVGGYSIVNIEDGDSREINIGYHVNTSGQIHDEIEWTTSDVNTNGFTAKVAIVHYAPIQQPTGVIHYCTAGGNTCELCSAGSQGCGQNGSYSLAFVPVSQVQLPVTTSTTTFDFDYSCPPTATPCWKELRSATMKTGGAFKYKTKYKYQYEGVNSTRGAGDPELNNLVDNPIVEKMFCFLETCTEAGTDPVSEKWTFARTGTTSTVSGPDGTISHHFYDPRIVSDWRHGLEWKTILPDNSAVYRKWAQNAHVNPAASDPGNPYIAREVRTLPQTSTLCTAADFVVDQNGNFLQKNETDFYTGACESLVTSGATLGYLRSTVSQYHASTPAAVAGGTTDDADAYWHPRNDSGWSPLNAERTVRAVSREEVRSGGPEGAVKAASQFSYDNAVTTANLTTEYKWNDAFALTTPLTAANAISVGRTYNSYGELQSETDPNGNTITTFYGYMYPSQRSLASLRQFTFDHTFQTGLLRSVTNDNGLAVSYQYDPLQRIRTKTEQFDGADQRKTEYIYNDVVVASAGKSSVTTKRDRDTASDQALYDIVTHDVRGRVLNTERYSLTTVQNVKTERRYRWSGGSHYVLESNPYTVTPDGWTVSVSDALGRSVARYRYGADLPVPWGTNSTVLAGSSSAYTNNTQTVTSETGTTKYIVYDALGRISEVTEAGDGAGRARYFYDILDNLTKVEHGTAPLTESQPCATSPNPLTRTFVYSSLSRLSSACSPESGTTQYTYDQAGNLLTRVDARNIVTCHGTLSGSVCNTGGYDGLNRLLKTTYSDATPGVSYIYDSATNGKGHLYSAVLTGTANGTTYNEYDKFGRAKKITQGLGGTSYQFQYTYNLADTLKTQTYPHSGRVISYATNSAGEVTGVTGLKGGTSTTYGSEITYSPHGLVNKLRFGTSSARYEQTCFTAGLAVSNVRVAATAPGCAAGPSGSEALYLAYTYNSGSITGNVGSQAIRRGGNIWTQAFDYDTRDRVTKITDSGFSQKFAYDTQGNMALADNETTLAPAGDLFYPHVANSSADVHALFPRNRWNGGAYDAAGNQTGINSGSFTFAFDAENRIKSATAPGMPAITYSYDAEGRRTSKTVGSATTTYVYDGLGRLALEFGAHSLTAGTHFLAGDALGSTRLMMSVSAAEERCFDYTPFGTQVGSGFSRGLPCFGSVNYPGNPDVVSTKFTGKERDSETGLDYFGLRYMSSAGKVHQPWSKPLIDQQREDPQSWNLYGYVRNNSGLRFTDPTGAGLRRPVKWE